MIRVDDQKRKQKLNVIRHKTKSLKSFDLRLSSGGISWNRTSDTRIFSPLLYRLSYDTVVFGTAKVTCFSVLQNFFSKKS